MKKFSIILLAVAIGLIGCGKKKKKEAAKETAEKTKDAENVQVSAGFKIVIEEGKSGPVLLVQEADPENSTNQAKDGCSLEADASKIKAERRLVITLDAENGTLVAKDGDLSVLEGTAADENKDKVEGDYKTADYTFKIGASTGETFLKLDKTCAKE